MRVFLRSVVVLAVLGAVAVPGAARAAAETRFGFDGGVGGLRTVARDGGVVRTVPGVSGTAIAFPPRCSGACARAVLIADAPAPDPGTGPITYGAHVRLPAGQTTAGSNVVQKGTWSTGSQWKLQIDGTAGHPGCALMGAGSRRMHVVTAPVSVADGGWHQVTCTRAGTAFGITVDGVARGSVHVPAGLNVHSGAPVRIGGNAVSPRADRFHGELDEVFVRVG